MIAGEAKDPRRTVPRAFRTIMTRLIVFFIGGAICVGVSRNLCANWQYFSDPGIDTDLGTFERLDVCNSDLELFETVVEVRTKNRLTGGSDTYAGGSP